jgi:hypothetical protein
MTIKVLAKGQIERRNERFYNCTLHDFSRFVTPACIDACAWYSENGFRGMHEAWNACMRIDWIYFVLVYVLCEKERDEMIGILSGEYGVESDELWRNFLSYTGDADGTILFFLKSYVGNPFMEEFEKIELEVHK